MPKLVVPLAIVGCWLAFLSCGVISATSHLAGSSAQSHYERPSTKGGPYQKRVIVFVHGIFGDADGTWRYSPSVYWPRLLLSDEAFRDSDVYVASYSSPYFGNTMNVDEVVTNLNNRLVSDEIFSKHREVVFVCHSLGGLIVQRLLLTFRDYAQQVPFIYFFSTPETGAQMANLASVFSSDPLLRALIPGDENVYLQNLENEWKAARFHIHRFCAYEKKKYKDVLIVDRLSGTRNCDDPPLAINEDHVSIVKPDGVNHDSYVALQNAFRQYPVAIGKSGAQATHSHVQLSHPAGLGSAIRNREDEIRFVGGYNVRPPSSGPSKPPGVLTLHGLFTEDFPQYWIPRIDTTIVKAGKKNTIESAIFLDFPGRSRFVGFYLPSDVDTYEVCKALPDAVELLIAHFASGHEFRADGIFDKSQTSFADLASTGRVYVYYEGILTLPQSGELDSLFTHRHLGLILRGDDWLRISILSRK
jgi:Alpha/beta hydrolase family